MFIIRNCFHVLSENLGLVVSIYINKVLFISIIRVMIFIIFFYLLLSLSI